jgi:phage terminase Nu1 subunit (DNA packaging protein)
MKKTSMKGDRRKSRLLAWPRVSRPQLAELLGKHVDTVSDFASQGMPVLAAGGHGRPAIYDAVACLRWARERLITVSPTDAARARRETAQAIESEQRAAIRSGQYIHVDDVERVWAFEIAAVRTAILATYLTESDRLHRVAITEGVGGVEAELKALAERLLRELAGDRPLPSESTPAATTPAPTASTARTTRATR